MLLDPKGPCFSCPAGPLLPKAVAAVLGWTPELSFRLLVPSLGLGFPTCKWVSRQFWVFPSRGALAPLPPDPHKATPHTHLTQQEGERCSAAPHAAGFQEPGEMDVNPQNPGVQPRPHRWGDHSQTLHLPLDPTDAQLRPGPSTGANVGHPANLSAGACIQK